jgi:hypothetical protein
MLRQTMGFRDVFRAQSERRRGQPYERILPPFPRVVDIQRPFRALESDLPIRDYAEQIGPGFESCFGCRAQTSRSPPVRKGRCSCRAVCRSQIAFKKTIQINRSIPARVELDATFPPS